MGDLQPFLVLRAWHQAPGALYSTAACVSPELTLPDWDATPTREAQRPEERTTGCAVRTTYSRHRGLYVKNPVYLLVVE